MSRVDASVHFFVFIGNAPFCHRMIVGVVPPYQPNLSDSIGLAETRRPYNAVKFFRLPFLFPSS